MTCVIGLETEEGVWIGADSAGTDGWGSQTLRADQKVFRNGPMIFGFCGSYRMGQLLRYSFTVPEHPEGMEDYEYMVKVFVEAVRDCLRKGGFTWIEKNTETGGDFLVGYNGKLYNVEEDFQVGMSSKSFAAVGSGEAYAMGAMDVLTEEDILPASQIKRALKAAAKYDAYVAAPFKVIKL